MYSVYMSNNNSDNLHVLPLILLGCAALSYALVMVLQAFRVIAGRDVSWTNRHSSIGPSAVSNVTPFSWVHNNDAGRSVVSQASVWCWNRLNFYSSVVSPVLASVQSIRLSTTFTSGIEFDQWKNNFSCNAHSANIILWTRLYPA